MILERYVLEWPYDMAERKSLLVCFDNILHTHVDMQCLDNFSCLVQVDQYIFGFKSYVQQPIYLFLLLKG